MRYVYLFLFVVLLTGCAHNRIRLHKVEKVDSVEMAETKKAKAFLKKDNPTQTVIDVSTQQPAAEEVTAQRETFTENQERTTIDTPAEQSPKSADTVMEETEDDPSQKQKVRAALVAEKDARKAKNAFIWSLSMFFLFFIPFVPLFSIIPFVIGSIKLNQSNKSDYITLEGEKEARSARIMQLIYAVLAGLALLAITILLMVFFL